MVFTISSNEHTLKTVLNSKMASNATIPYSPKFQLSTTINTPHNMVSMVCLESCNITPPSMFTNAVLTDGSNKFDRYIVDGNGDVIGNAQVYWNGMMGANGLTLGVAGGLGYDSQTNIQPVQFIMQMAQNVDLTNVENVVHFLAVFLMSLRGVTITFPYVPGDAQVAGGCCISWISGNVYPNYGSLTVPIECFNDNLPWGTAGTNAAFTEALLVTRLQTMN